MVKLFIYKKRVIQVHSGALRWTDGQSIKSDLIHGQSHLQSFPVLFAQNFISLHDHFADTT